MMKSSGEIISRARDLGVGIPAFNVPYLPMIKPVVQAVADADAFALIEVARPDWLKFEAKGMAAVMEEYQRWERSDRIRLHLDHVPVVDEDDLEVDYLPIIEEAITLGYASVMVDGSRLDLEANIAATRKVAVLAHAAGIACEAELGAVLGHGAGPLPPYEELFASGRGFTDVAEAQRFVAETECDWLSVAVGNIHGAISEATRDKKKVAARLDLEHLERLHAAVGIPLVLHGGSGVQQEYVLGAMKRGIAKVNVCTEIRQAYEQGLKEGRSVDAGREAVYERTLSLLRDDFGLAGIGPRILGDGAP